MFYLNLDHQIEVGIEKGHTETEIVEAVIRAVSPGLPLRDMLEIKHGLTILKGHYNVDSSTKLEDTGEQYSRATIQRKLLCSVKFQILPHLSNLSITDEELIERES